MILIKAGLIIDEELKPGYYEKQNPYANAPSCHVVKVNHKG